jgi:hypothetical protein
MSLADVLQRLTRQPNEEAGACRQCWSGPTGQFLRRETYRASRFTAPRSMAMSRPCAARPTSWLGSMSAEGPGTVATRFPHWSTTSSQRSSSASASTNSRRASSTSARTSFRFATSRPRQSGSTGTRSGYERNISASPHNNSNRAKFLIYVLRVMCGARSVETSARHRPVALRNGVIANPVEPPRIHCRRKTRALATRGLPGDGCTSLWRIFMRFWRSTSSPAMVRSQFAILSGGFA